MNLPVELWMKILGYLDILDVMAWELSSKQFSRYIRTPMFKLYPWAHLYIELKTLTPWMIDGKRLILAAKYGYIPLMKQMRHRVGPWWAFRAIQEGFKNGQTDSLTALGYKAMLIRMAAYYGKRDLLEHITNISGSCTVKFIATMGNQIDIANLVTECNMGEDLLSRARTYPKDMIDSLLQSGVIVP